jgi:hypothetical protein
MEAEIVIPSYNRTDLCQKIINLIIDYGFKNTPFVFLSNNEQLNLYTDVKNCNKIVTFTHGIQAKRNFIYSFFDEGTHVVSLDDSYTGMKKKKDNELVDFNNVYELSKIGYQEMRKKNTCMYGINIVENPFFLKNKISFGNYALSAKFYGFISQPYPFFNSTNPTGLCEDQESCLRVTKKYGGVIRFSGITFNKPQYRKLEGGIQSYLNNKERIKKEKQGRIFLMNMFKDLLKLKNGGLGLKYKRI